MTKNFDIDQQRQAKLAWVNTVNQSAAAKLQKAWKRGGRKAAMDAMCQECMGYEWIPDAIRNCTSPLCPLYEYRQGHGHKSSRPQNEGLKRYRMNKLGGKKARSVVGVGGGMDRNDLLDIMGASKSNKDKNL